MIAQFDAHDGILLCGHGSRDPTSVAGFAAIARGLGPLLGRQPFSHGFMELADPDLETATGALVAAGARRILAVPGFLFTARHMQEDLPRELAVAADRHQVQVHLGLAMGADARLVEALADRARQAASGVDADEGAPTALLLVGAGSSNAATNAGLAPLAQRLGTRLGGLTALCAFASVAEPTVEMTIERLLNDGHRRIVMVPWFLTDGSLLGLARTKARRTMAGRGVLIEAQALGPHPAVLETLAARAGELALRLRV